jgi:hypothetical protein
MRAGRHVDQNLPWVTEQACRLHCDVGRELPSERGRVVGDGPRALLQILERHSHEERGVPQPSPLGHAQDDESPVLEVRLLGGPTDGS